MLPDTTSPDPPPVCVICQLDPAIPGKLSCASCHAGVTRVKRRAAATTALRLAPEAGATVATCVVAAFFSPWWLLVLLPIAGVAALRARFIFKKQLRLRLSAFLRNATISGPPDQPETAEQRETALFLADLERELIAQGIPISTELQEVLRGQRRPTDLPEDDQKAIRPALLAAMQRRQQRQADGDPTIDLSRESSRSC